MQKSVDFHCVDGLYVIKSILDSLCSKMEMTEDPKVVDRSLEASHLEITELGKERKYRPSEFCCLPLHFFSFLRQGLSMYPYLAYNRVFPDSAS